MDVDQYFVWFISSLKASIDGDEVNESKLNKNVRDCFLRVKKACSSGNKDGQYDDFRARATLLLLLCCPRIHELPIIQACRDFQAVAMALPVLKESVFFSVVRTQKNYCFLAPVMSWVSPGVLQEITKEFFIYIDEMTPLTLAISLELLRGLLFSLQCNSADFDSALTDVECLDLLLKFLSSKSVSDKTQVQVKSGSYYFMYICECLYLMLTVCAGSCLKEPDTYPSLQTWTNLWKNTFKEKAITGCNCLCIRKYIESFLNLCQQSIEAISVDVWIKWNELILPASVNVHRNSLGHQGKSHQKSIQSVTCNIAFDILKIFNSHPEMHETLNTSAYQSLLQFFKQVASDPDYDPDQDLTQVRLIQEISLKDERQRKLLSILSRREDIFKSLDCWECINEYSTVVDDDTRQEILLRFIQHVKGGEHYIPEWADLIIELAASLPARQLLPVIEDHLAAGLEEILKTADFASQLTAVFNQLTAKESAGPSEKHVWLCLQSGKAVVEHAVMLAVSLSGLVPVMVQALTAIPQVCQAILPSGESLLVSTLRDRQKNGFSSTEEQEFASLVKGFLGAENLLAASKVLKVMIEPFLVVTSSNLALPLDLLKEIVEHEPAAVVKPGPEVVSLILTLVHIIHSTVNLSSQKAPGILSLRMEAFSILSVILANMTVNLQNYEKDISLLKQLIVRYQLHPRSVLPLAQILELEECQNSYADCVLHVMMRIELGVQQGKHRHLLSKYEVSKTLIGISRSKWIIALLKLLPHSSEYEWMSAFFLTHHLLQSENMVYPTLQVFQEILYLVCAYLTAGSVTKDETLDVSPFQPASISIQHCFKSFATAAMMYVEELLQPLPSDKRFQCIGSIFRWWCQVVSLYQCNPDLPSLFLVRLSVALAELITSGNLEISKQKDSGGKKQSDMNGVEESKLQNVTEIGVINEEMLMLRLQGSDLPKKMKENQDEDLNSHYQIELHNELQASNTNEEINAQVKNENSLIVSDREETYTLQDACDESEVPLRIIQENNCHKIRQFNNVKISSNNRSPVKMIQKTMNTEGFKITYADFKREIEKMIFTLVKYVPVSNLVSSVASKLKKLYEF